MPSREIVNGVFLIDTLAGGVPGLAASYLIRGEKSALVDSGYATSANTVLSELQALNGKSWHADYLIPTHVHLDHSGGVGHLATSMPDAQVLVSARGAKHLIDPTRLVESAAGLFGEEELSVFGKPIGVPRERIIQVGDSYNLDLGAGKILRLFWTPGHAPHHLSVLIEGERLLITGDAVGMYYPGFETPIPATPPPSFDEGQYMETLNRMLNIHPTGLLLPHFGPVLRNVDGFLRTNLETVRRWGLRVSEALRLGEPMDHVFEYFMEDVARQLGRSQHGFPEYITRMIMISAMGYYSYVQKTGCGQ